jgi:hypothetical protein
MCVSSKGPLESCDRIFATERPTVPKPTMAIFSLRSANGDFLEARAREPFGFEERDEERDDERDFPNDPTSGYSSYQRPEKTRRGKAA